MKAKNHTRKIGEMGELYAEKYLTSQNYRVIKKNYRIWEGEIDLIAIDEESGELVFAEVKTRTTTFFGAPQDSVNFQKRQKILKTALHFLNSAREKGGLNWRVDVIAVKLNSRGKLDDITHFKNIFDGA